MLASHQNIGEQVFCHANLQPRSMLQALPNMRTSLGLPCSDERDFLGARHTLWRLSGELRRQRAKDSDPNFCASVLAACQQMLRSMGPCLAANAKGEHHFCRQVTCLSVNCCTHEHSCIAAFQLLGAPMTPNGRDDKTVLSGCTEAGWPLGGADVQHMQEQLEADRQHLQHVAWQLPPH